MILCKKKKFLWWCKNILWSYFTMCSPVLAITISYFAAYGLMSLANVQAQNWWNDFYIFLWLCLCVAIVTILKLAYVPCWSIYVQSLVLCLEDVYSHSNCGTLILEAYHHHFKGLIQCAAHLQRLMYLVLIRICGKVHIQSSTLSNVNLNTLDVRARSVVTALVFAPNMRSSNLYFLNNHWMSYCCQNMPV